MSDTIEMQSEELCLLCGLCCDGSLFGMARVGMNDDRDALEKNWFVTMEEKGKQWFLQPCPNYRDEECRIYDCTAKPFICNHFKCVLLAACRNGEMAWGEAKAIIKNTKEMIRSVKSGLGPSGREDAPPSFNERLKKLEVMALLEEFSQENSALLSRSKELTKFLERYFRSEGLVAGAGPE